MTATKFKKAIHKLNQSLNGSRKEAYVNLDNMFSNTKDYTLFSYTDEDGNFDYESYKTIQENANKKKLDRVWVLEENIEFLSDYLKEHLNPIKSSLCHGTRRGKEQEWFKKYLGDDVDVIGTEISDTADDFPHTIQWDFHETKKEWLNKVDFIYSNSFDHSYDPQKCLDAWTSCLRPGGICVIEHTDGHGAQGSSQMDPFGAHLLQMPLLISKWGREKYGLVDILKSPIKRDDLDFTAFLIIEKY